MPKDNIIMRSNALGELSWISVHDGVDLYSTCDSRVRVVVSKFGSVLFVR